MFNFFPPRNIQKVRRKATDLEKVTIVQVANNQ